MGRKSTGDLGNHHIIDLVLKNQDYDQEAKVYEGFY